MTETVYDDANREPIEHYQAEAQRLAAIAHERDAAALPEPIIPVEIESVFDIELFYGTDDVPVVEISTLRVPGRVRVNLNDGVIWDGDPEEDERPGKHAARLPHELASHEPIIHHVAEPVAPTASYMIEEAGEIVPQSPDGGVSDSERLAVRRNLHAADRETISRQLDTIRDQAERIDELQGERDRLASDYEGAKVIVGTQGDEIERLCEILSEESATVGTLTGRLEAEMNETRAAVRARGEADAMRRKLDARLGEERDAYIASSTALQSVIRNYDGLAQYGANLARAVTAERPDLSEAGSLGRAYLREMTTRFGA